MPTTDSTQQSNIFYDSLEGMREVLSALFGIDQKSIVLVTSNNVMRQKARAAGKFTFPALGLKLNAVSRKQDGFNNFALRRAGVRAGNSPKEELAYKYHVVHSVVQFQLFAYFDDEKKSLDYIQNYLAVGRSIAFQIGDDKFSVDITMQFDPDCQMGDMTQEDVGSLYEIQSGVTLTTYIGTMQKTPTLNQISVSVGVEGNADVSQIDTSTLKLRRDPLTGEILTTRKD